MKTMATNKGTGKKLGKGDEPAVQGDEAQLKHVVSIRPGSSAGQVLRFTVDGDVRDYSVEKIIQYGLDQNHARKGQRIADTLKREVRDSYGVTAFDETVGKTRPASELFRRQLGPDGETPYMGLDLVVASKQTGGYNALESVTSALYRA